MESSDKRVYDREEFTQMLMERVSDITKIGPVVQFVDSALRLQNDMSRPVYVLEFQGEPDRERVDYVNEVMAQLGVTCVLVPPNTVEYVGEVTEESFGTRNIRADVFGLRDGVKIPVVEKGDVDGGKHERPGNEPEGVEGPERGGDPSGRLQEGDGEDEGRG